MNQNPRPRQKGVAKSLRTYVKWINYFVALRLTLFLDSVFISARGEWSLSFPITSTQPYLQAQIAAVVFSPLKCTLDAVQISFFFLSPYLYNGLPIFPITLLFEQRCSTQLPN
ncbi:hypothetical protein DL96DRAFT_1578872 [Flagelloscypha sp. PMI_526]|nr:hypothetical protein DL96DRAFT_1578872 [Flagelloscypha sp. PMI_526]